MRLLFFDRSTKLETVTDLERRARGGMVNSLFRVTDYLSWMGHDVTVLSDIASSGWTKLGTKWLHEAHGEYDVLVMNRGIEYGHPNIRARRRVLWTHDLPHSGFAPEPKMLRGIDRVVFMSKYAERAWRAFYRDIGKSVYIPNGVQKRWFYPRVKDWNYLLYASAPNRGLDKLPLILDAVDTRVSGEVWMRAYSNMETLHPNEAQHEPEYDYTSIEESGVELKKPIPQQQFAQQLGKAAMLILPSGYPEICSNVVLQALASGTPVITTGNMGATPEWVRHKTNGMLTQHQPHDYMVHILEMVRNIVKVLEDRRLHKRLMRGARKTKVLTWAQVGKLWDSMLQRLG